MVILSTFLLFIGVYRSAVGEKVHELTLCSICRLDVNINVGNIVRWTNTRNETLRLIGEESLGLNLTIPAERTASYTFQNRGTYRYRVNTHAWNLGIIRVQHRIEKRSSTQATKGTGCMSLCNATKITDLSSGNLCRLNFDYVIHGKVRSYNPVMHNHGIVKKYVVLDVLDDYMSRNGIASSNTSVSFLWMSPVEGCFCPALRLGTEFVIMGYRLGSEMVIDTRTRASKWEPKLRTQLSSYQHKVNTPSCS